jgi:chitobiase/beta-hexosaminidase-like protein
VTLPLVGDPVEPEDVYAGTIIARGRRTSNSTASASEQGVLRLDDIPITNGRLYQIYTSGLMLDSTVANDESRARIRYTTDGSTPTTSSTILPGSQADYRQADAGIPEHVHIRTTYAPSSDQTLSLLLTTSRIAGTGNISIGADGTSNVCDLYVMDCGEDPGDTGVDI